MSENQVNPSENTAKISHEEKAKELFTSGCNCAQAVFCSFCDEMDFDKSLGLKLSSSFGGGMGRLREVCGAVSGMFLVAGALYGYDDISDAPAKAAHYERLQGLAKRFRDENGSIVCRELLGLVQKSDAPTPSERTPEYYKKRPCVELVGMAARFMEEYIAEHPYNK